MKKISNIELNEIPTNLIQLEVPKNFRNLSRFESELIIPEKK